MRRFDNIDPLAIAIGTQYNNVFVRTNFYLHGADDMYSSFAVYFYGMMSNNSAIINYIFMADILSHLPSVSNSGLYIYSYFLTL